MTDALPFISVVIPGPPQAKQRHRSRIAYNKDGKPFVSNYPDPGTLKFETMVAQLAKLKMGNKDLLDEAATLLVEAFVPVPESWSQKKKVEAIDGWIMPTSRPDWDNYGKISDAFNKVVWRDDSIVVCGQVLKRYGVRPCWRATVWRYFDVNPRTPTLPGLG